MPLDAQRSPPPITHPADPHLSIIWTKLPIVLRPRIASIQVMKARFGELFQERDRRQPKGLDWLANSIAVPATDNVFRRKAARRVLEKRVFLAAHDIVPQGEMLGRETKIGAC
jgi:hypothetical protein